MATQTKIMVIVGSIAGWVVTLGMILMGPERVERIVTLVMIVATVIGIVLGVTSMVTGWLVAREAAKGPPPAPTAATYHIHGGQIKEPVTVPQVTLPQYQLMPPAPQAPMTFQSSIPQMPAAQRVEFVPLTVANVDDEL